MIGTNHVHTGSLDWKRCYLCNPDLPEPEPIVYIYTCIKCGRQFLTHKYKKEKKRICKNCK